MHLNTRHLLQIRSIVLLVILSAVVTPAIGQPGDTGEKRISESFAFLPDGIIKSEIASFAVTALYEEVPALEVVEIPFKACNDTMAVCADTEVAVTITTGDFDPAGHRLDYSDGPDRYLQYVDDHQVWGTDGGLPSQCIRSVTITSASGIIQVPDEFLGGLFEPDFCLLKTSVRQTTNPFCKAFWSLDKERLYIYMLNGDGAGGYEVTLCVQKDGTILRVVDHGF